MTPVVLDASAVLAAILGEPGHVQMLALDRPFLISAVNLAEVQAKLADHGMPPEAADLALTLLDLETVDFTAAQARLSANLRAPTRRAGLSLGDRACLALAAAMQGVAVTADRAWATLDLPVTVTCIR